MSGAVWIGGFIGVGERGGGSSRKEQVGYDLAMGDSEGTDRA